MYSGFKFARFRNLHTQAPPSAWWLIMAPGLLLIFMALAILIWPELLAYMVAFAMLFVGLALAGWGWTLRRAEKQMRRKMHDDRNGYSNSETVIYYER
jgi:uncharacterized membrane protein YqjE